MSHRIRYSQHALQRLDERGILRRLVDAVLASRPQVHGRHEVFTLTASELASRCGGDFQNGLCVVVDRFRRRVMTAHWFPSGVA